MTKWEYVTTPLLLHKETQILNTWGTKGWELVQVTTGPQGGMIAFFKRPLQDGAADSSNSSEAGA